MLQSSMNFDGVTKGLNSNITSREAKITAAVSDPKFGEDIGQTIKMNFDVALWSATVNATQNVVKEIGDAMKSVVQKAG